MTLSRLHLCSQLWLGMLLIANKFKSTLEVCPTSAILTITDVAHFPPNVRLDIGWVTSVIQVPRIEYRIFNSYWS
ncbi:MAG: hypothetical protein CML06_18765 [Pseudomonadales bacterium]|mgnify:CR=1 FL=1|nr:hypothetical protein [Pseudomonadales bacterium]